MRLVHAAAQRAHGDVPQLHHALVGKVQLRGDVQRIPRDGEIRHLQRDVLRPRGHLYAHKPERAPPEVLKHARLVRGIVQVKLPGELAVLAVVAHHWAGVRALLPGEVALGIGELDAAALPTGAQPQERRLQHARVQLDSAGLPGGYDGDAVLVERKAALALEVGQHACERPGLFFHIGNGARLELQRGELAPVAQPDAERLLGGGPAHGLVRAPVGAAVGAEGLRAAHKERARGVQREGFVAHGRPVRLAGGQLHRAAARQRGFSDAQEHRAQLRVMHRKRRILVCVRALIGVGDDARGQIVLAGRQVWRDVHRLVVVVAQVALARPADDGDAIDVEAVAVGGAQAHLGAVGSLRQRNLQPEQRSLQAIARAYVQPRWADEHGAVQFIGHFCEHTTVLISPYFAASPPKPAGQTRFGGDILLH